MNNKIIYFIAFILIFGSLFSFYSIEIVRADSSTLCNPDISLINQDPAPAVPNGYVKVIFEVSNLGNCPNGFSVKLDPQYPFSLDSGTNPVQELKQNPFTTNDYKSVWNVPYTIRVAQDALEGDYYLNLLYSTGANKNFNYLSASQSFNISIRDVQTNFYAVVQDYANSQVSVGIVNTGKNTANSMVVSIPQQNGFTVTGTSQQIVGNLAAGDYTIVSFKITPRALNGGAGFNGTRSGINGGFNRTNFNK